VGSINIYRINDRCLDSYENMAKYSSHMLIFEKLKLKLKNLAFGKKYSPYKNNYHFTEDWFTPSIPVWTHTLKKLAKKKNLKALEIGTFEGRSAPWLLENILTHESSSLVCIDAYAEVHNHALQTFQHNLKVGGLENRVVIFVKNSLDTLPQLQPQKFDFIYIDGHHEGDLVYQESELCWPLLKQGGILIFDDYLWTATYHVGRNPKEGIDQFLKKRASQIKILFQDYQVIVKKIDD